MEKSKKKSLSHEEAAELYRDLHKAVNKLRDGKKAPSKPAASSGDYPPGFAAKIAAALMGREVLPEKTEKPGPAVKEPVDRVSFSHTAIASGPQFQERMLSARRGQYAAIVFVFAFAVLKVMLAVMEATGFASASDAEASVANLAGNSSVKQSSQVVGSSISATPGLSKEEIRILTTLDARRVELEERSKRLDDREDDMSRRDKEFVLKLAQLRDLNDKLKGEREKDDKKRNAQLDQLANVYGSMAPQEAATLMEQLDISIALSLIERMPEKRIGQILALMNKEKALALTRMLSGRVGNNT